MRLRELFEALTADQKNHVDEELGKLEYDPTQWDSIFDDQDRIYLAVPPLHPNVEVYRTLKELGYKIVDYAAGLAISRTPKQYDIRKVLSKNPELLSRWENDSARTMEPEQDQVGGFDLFSTNWFHDDTVIADIKSLNYKVVDYENGILSKEPVPESIGNIFSKNKIDKRILQLFANDAARKTVHEFDSDINDAEDLLIVISRNKYDVAEVGTNKSWSNESCLNLGGGWTGPDTLGRKRGVNAKHSIIDISVGCLATYLIYKSDIELNNPLARISIKPFINEYDPDQVALGVHDKVYAQGGTYPPIYRDLVVKWADGINASRELDGLFKLHPKAYNWTEFKSTEKKFGNLTKYSELYDEYGDDYAIMPDDQRSMMYIKYAIQRSRTVESVRDAMPYMDTAKKAIDIIVFGLKNGCSVVVLEYFPDEYGSNVDIVNELVSKCLELDDGVFNKLLETPMFDTLYNNGKSYLNKFYKEIDKNSPYVIARFFRNVEDDYSEKLVPLLLEFGPITNRSVNTVVDMLLAHGDMTDERVLGLLLSLSSNTNLDLVKLPKIFKVIPELGEKFKKTAAVRVQELSDKVKSSVYDGDLRQVLSDIKQYFVVYRDLGEDTTPMVSLFSDISLLAEDESIVIECIPHINDEKILLRLLKRTSSGDVISRIANKFEKPSSEILAKIKKAWYSFGTLDEYTAARLCNYPDVLAELLSKNLFDEYTARNFLVARIKENDFPFDNDLREMVVAFINRVDTEQLEWFGPKAFHKNGPEFQQFLADTLVSRVIPLIKNNDQFIGTIIPDLLRELADWEVDVKFIEAILDNFSNTRSQRLFKMVLFFYRDKEIPKPILKRISNIIDDYSRTSDMASLLTFTIDALSPEVASMILKFVTNADALVDAHSNTYDEEVMDLITQRFIKLSKTYLDESSVRNFIETIHLRFVTDDMLKDFLKNPSVLHALDSYRVYLENKLDYMVRYFGPSWRSKVKILAEFLDKNIVDIQVAILYNAARSHEWDITTSEMYKLVPKEDIKDIDVIIAKLKDLQIKIRGPRW